MKKRNNLYLDQLNNWVTAKESPHDALDYFNKRFDEYKWVNTFKKPLLSSIVNVCSPFNPNKEIFTSEDFNDYVEWKLDAWLMDLSVKTHPQYCREVTEDDSYDESEPQFMYTNKGSKMIERAIERFRKIGEKYFDEFCIEIKTSMYNEY